MKRTLLLLSLAVLVLPAVSGAEEIRWDVLRVYKLADGQGVAVAYPGEWRELTPDRTLQPGAPARFVDENGRRVDIPAAALARAAETRAIARPESYRKVALRAH
jgi:hypothetical protein